MLSRRERWNKDYDEMKRLGEIYAKKLLAFPRKRKANPRWYRISGRTVSRLKNLLRRHNVEMGFTDATGFHPIRASKDYSMARAGERRARSYRARGTRLRSATRRGTIRRG